MPKSIDEFSRPSDSLRSTSESSVSQELFFFPRPSCDSDDGSISRSSFASFLSSADPSISKAAAKSPTAPAVKSFTESFMDRTKSILQGAISYFTKEEPKASLSSVITPLSETSRSVRAVSCLMESNKNLRTEHAQGSLKAQLIQASSILEDRISTLTDDKLKEKIQADVNFLIPRLGKASKETVTWMKELVREYCVNGDREKAFVIGQVLCILEPNDPDHWIMQAYLAEGDAKEVYYNEANRLKASPIIGSSTGLPREALPFNQLNSPGGSISLKVARHLEDQVFAPLPNLRSSKEPVPSELVRRGPSLKSKPMTQLGEVHKPNTREIPESLDTKKVFEGFESSSPISASSDPLLLGIPILSSSSKADRVNYSVSSAFEPSLKLPGLASPEDRGGVRPLRQIEGVNSSELSPSSTGLFLIFLNNKRNTDKASKNVPNLEAAGHILDAKLNLLTEEKQEEIREAIREGYRTETLPQAFKDWMIDVALDFREQNTPESRGWVVILKTALSAIDPRGFQDFLRAYYDRFPINGETFPLFEPSKKFIGSALIEPSDTMGAKAALNELPSRNRGKDSSPEIASLDMPAVSSPELSIDSKPHQRGSPDESRILRRQPMSNVPTGVSVSRGPKKRKPELSLGASLPSPSLYRREEPREKPSKIPSFGTESAVFRKERLDEKINEITLPEPLESPPLLPSMGSFLLFLNNKIHKRQTDENLSNLEAAGRLLDWELYSCVKEETESKIRQAMEEGYSTGSLPQDFKDWMIKVALDYESEGTPTGESNSLIMRKALAAIDPQGFSSFLRAYFVRFPINGEVSRSPILREAIVRWGEEAFESRRDEILKNIEYEDGKEGYVEYDDLGPYEIELSYRKQALVDELNQVGYILEKAILGTDGLEKRASLTKGMLSLLKGEEKPEIIFWIKSLAEKQPENASTLLLFVSLLEDLRAPFSFEDDLAFLGDISGSSEVESSKEISLLEESELSPYILGDFLSRRLVAWVDKVFEYKIFEIARVMDVFKDPDTLSDRKKELLERFRVIGKEVGDVLQRELGSIKNIEEKKQICRYMDAFMQRGNSLEARRWIEEVAAKNPEHAAVIFQFLFFIDPSNPDYESESVVKGAFKGMGDSVDYQGAIYDALTGTVDETGAVTSFIRVQLQRARLAFGREDTAESLNDLNELGRAIETRYQEINSTIQVIIKSLIEKASRKEVISWHEVLICSEALGDEKLLKILDFFDPMAITSEKKAWNFFLQRSLASPEGVSAFLVSIGKQLLDKEFDITRFLAYGQTEQQGREEMFSRLLIAISIMERNFADLSEKERVGMQNAIKKAITGDSVAKKSAISWMEDTAWALRCQKEGDVKGAIAIFHILVLLDPERSNYWSYLGDITKEAAYSDEAVRLLGVKDDYEEKEDEVEKKPYDPIAADVSDSLAIKDMEHAFASLEEELSSLEKEVAPAQNTKVEIEDSIKEPVSNIKKEESNPSLRASVILDDWNPFEAGPSIEGAINAFTMNLLSKGRKIIQGGEYGLHGGLAREYLMENLDMVGAVLQENIESLDLKERAIIRDKIVNTFSGHVDKDVIATLMFLAEHYEKTWKEGSSAFYLALIFLDPTNIHRQQWYSQVRYPDLVASLVGRKKVVKENLLRKVEWKSEDSMEILSDRLFDDHKIEMNLFISANKEITEEEIQEWIMGNLQITGEVLETVLERFSDPLAKNIMQNKMEGTLEGTPDPEVVNGLMVIAQEYQEKGLQDSARSIYRTLAFLDPSSSNIEEWRNKGKEGLDEAYKAIFEILLKEKEVKNNFGEKIVPKST